MLLIFLLTLSTQGMLSYFNSDNTLFITLSLEDLDAVEIGFEKSNQKIKCHDCHCEELQGNNLTFEHLYSECFGRDVQIIIQNTNLIPFQIDRQNRMLAVTYSDSDLTNSKVVSTLLTLKWAFSADGTSIDIAVIWGLKSWFGIGMGSSMTNTDMIIANVVNDQVSLIDAYSTGPQQPSADSQQDLTNISYQVTSSSISYRFTRKLDTGDSKDKQLTKGSTYTFSWASSSSLSIQQHSTQGTFQITLTDNGSSSSSTSSSTATTTGTTGTTSGTTTGSTTPTDTASGTTTTTGSTPGTSNNTTSNTTTGNVTSTASGSNSTTTDTQTTKKLGYIVAYIIQFCIIQF